MLPWEEMEKEEIKADEGLRLKAYQDSLGNWTIGYGHTTDEDEVGEGKTITKCEAEELLETDFEQAVTETQEVFPFFATLDGPRKGALVNMCFNMGPKALSSFHGTLAAIEAEDWDKAAKNIMNSKYARQVKGRASRIAYRIRTGEYAVR